MDSLSTKSENFILKVRESLQAAEATSHAILVPTIQLESTSNHEERDENKQLMITQLLTTVPDSIINFNYRKEMPASKKFLGVTMFADVSGFTALTEKYSTMETGGKSGTDKLCATLNTYIGMIVDEIVMRKGDVVKFAGDAILAVWKFSEIGHNAKKTLNKVIKCCFDIQNKCDNYMTEVGIVLRVKLAVAVGSMCLTIVGLPKAKQFDLSGSAIVDVGIAEKEATPGAIILSQLAWANCDQNLFSVESLHNGRFFRVKGHAQSEKKSENKRNEMITSNLQTTQRIITSDIDHLIDKVLDYRQDMPKALLPDDDEKGSAGLYLTKKILPGKKKPKKEKKFDRLTMTSNLSDDEVRDLRAYVPGQVLYKLDHGQSLEWLSEMRQVSVLFINMKLPDSAFDASEALQKSFEVIYEACSEFSGTLNKVFSFDKGCTFIVIFGLPGQKHEDDAIRALRCAHSIFESLHALQEICNESIGVTTGVAFCGVVGHKDRHEYTVIGSKVNMAARLMMFYPGMLTCDNDTYEATRMRLREEDFIMMPYIELKGLKDPGAVREYDPHSNQKEEEEDFDYPILGRSSEKYTFDTLLHEYLEKKQGKVIVIAGAQGIGKTRLLEEFMDDAVKLNCKVIDLSVNTNNEGNLASNMVKILLGNNDEERQAALLPLMQEDKEIQENIGLIGDIVGKNTNVPQQLISDLGEIERRTNAILLKIFSMITKQESSYFVAIDDAMNIGENSWKFLTRLIDETNILIAFTLKSWDNPDLCTQARRILQNESNHRFLLQGLDKDTMVDFVCQLLNVNKIPKKLSTIIDAKGQGIPSWCEQLISNMLYSNLIQVVPFSDVLMSNNKVVSEDQRQKDYFELETEDLDKDIDLSSSQYITSLETRVKEQSMMNFQDRRSSSSSNIQQFGIYCEKDYLEGTVGAVSGDSHNICVISPSADVNAMLVPDSVEDMVLSRMDRMTLIEQTVIKCAAVLGMSFTRDLLKAIIPKNCINMLDTTLQNLTKVQFFECGSLAAKSTSTHDMPHHSTGGMNKPHHQTHIQNLHNTQVMCGCYAYEGFPVINLLQANAFSDGKKRICLFFQFCNTFVQEAAYALWLEDQRKALFEKAASYLEVYSDKCRACGGTGFIPGHGVGMSISTKIDKSPVRQQRYSLAVHKTRVASMKPDFVHFQDLKTIIPSIAKTDKIPKTTGDVIGIALTEMARIYASIKEEEDNASTSKTPTNFLRKGTVRPTNASNRMALQASLKNFCNSLVASNRSANSIIPGRDRANTVGGLREIDLSQCQCLELQARILPKLVHYCKSSGHKLKAFQYSVDAAAVALDTNDSVKAMSILKSIDELLKEQDAHDNFSVFVVSDEDKSRIESLKGQALCRMECFDEGIRHFIAALEFLKYPHPPVSSFGVWFRTWKASLVQLLHQKMPGVFIDTRREYNSKMIEQINILSQLAKAYRAKKEYDKAYLANLEQLNMAEEIANDCWFEVMGAYTDMISSCHIYGRETMGHNLEKVAIQTAESATIKLEDMLAVGSLHLSLLGFYLYTENISKAVDSGTAAYKIGTSVKDIRFLINCIPLYAQVSLMKMRYQSCDEMITELREMTDKLDGRVERWMYYSCCIDLLLHVGDNPEIVSELNLKLKRNVGGYTGFSTTYVTNGLALWYARNQKWGNALAYYIDELNEEPPQNVDPLFHCNLIAMCTEYLLHRFRQNPTEQTRHQVQETLKIFGEHHYGKSGGLLQARRFHFQAYFAYLRKKHHRARLLLEDCLIESKTNDLTFDYEWALASKKTWFMDPDVDIEQQTGSSIRYILPRIS